MLIGCSAAIANGLALPLFTILFKDLIDQGFDIQNGETSSQVYGTALQFLFLSFGLFVCGTVSNAFLLWSAARQGTSMRKKYLRCILNQDIAWFDSKKTTEITTSIERDCANVQGAIGEKL